MKLQRDLTFLCLILTFAFEAPARAQSIRTLSALEREHEAIALVARVGDGRLVAGIRTNEAFQQSNRPASLFKLAIGVAALNSGRFDRRFEYDCRGVDTINGTEQRCWNHDGHGRLGFRKAMAMSCNLYFRRAALRLTSSEILLGARDLGMLSPSGFRGSSEGHIAEPVLTDANLMGESFIVSPAQMLRTALVLASHGKRSIGSGIHLGTRFRPLYDGLVDCVRIGTGSPAWNRRFTIAGKTGTDEQVGTIGRTDGWFIGYAPADAPRYAVVVLYKNRRGSDAAKLAQRVFEEVL